MLSDRDMKCHHGLNISGGSIEPASVDLHLANEFAVMDGYGAVDVADESTYPDTTIVTDDKFEIEPYQFVLAETDEYVELPIDISGILHGRSSLGRLGLFVENAGFVDPSFEGTLTLELFNAAPYPITLHSGMRIIQMVLFETKNIPSAGYGCENGNKYSGQAGPTASKLYDDFVE